MTTTPQRLIGLHHHSLDALGDFPSGDPGDILYYDADSALQVLAPGTDGQILSLVGGFPAYVDPTAGTPAALTKTDDTNVTVTLGGTPTTALLQAVSLTLGWTGLLSLARGGSGADLSATGGTKQYVKQATVGGAFTVGTIPASDIASGAALTKTDDTNVTLSLGGTPASALLKAASLTLGWTGLLGLARGGTHADLSATGGAANYLKQSSVGADVTVGTIPASDIASGAALTKTDDTNVTLSLGGTPASALLKAASLTLGWTGLLGLARGGTHADLSATGGAGKVLKQTTLGADVTVGTLAASEIASGAALTRTNDTNVTLTLGGTPASALLVAASLTLGWTGLLGLARGGTHADLSATGGAGQYLKQVSAGADVTVGTIPASDIASGAALTKTDDTNVTLSLGGTPASALLAAASLTLGWTGVLSVARGGTGAATLTSQGVLVGSGTSIISPTTVNASATRKFLMQVSGNFPIFDTIGTSDLPANGANPSGLIGMSAVNGSATTWLRSDGHSAIDPAIAPTWTGVHTFSGTTAPQIIVDNSASGNAIIRLVAKAASVAEVSFRDGSNSKWQLLKNTDNSFGLNDLATPMADVLHMVAGSVPGVSTVGYMRIGSATAPGAVTAGDLTFVRAFVNNDANFNLAFSGSNPVIGFDSGDSLIFTRSANQWDFLIGSASVLTLFGGAGAQMNLQQAAGSSAVWIQALNTTTGLGAHADAIYIMKSYNFTNADWAFFTGASHIDGVGDHWILYDRITGHNFQVLPNGSATLSGAGGLTIASVTYPGAYTTHTLGAYSGSSLALGGGLFIPVYL